MEKDRQDTKGAAIAPSVVNLYQKITGDKNRDLDGDKTSHAQIICINRTNNPEELAAIYSATDVFINAGREESFGMTTLEAMRCGTRVVAYDLTASGEIIEEEMGEVVPVGPDYLFEAVTGRAYTNQGCGILCIPKTNDSEALAAIYSAADVFVNPTHEDNYPTVNLEAIACGTRVITYDVGGARETVDAEPETDKR